MGSPSGLRRAYVLKRRRPRIQSNGNRGVLLVSSPDVSSTIGGTAAGLGNGGGGISVVGSSGVSIGGTLAGAGVLVQGNLGDGIDFDDKSTGGHVTDSTVSGNSGVGIKFLGMTGTSLSGEVLSGDLIQSNQSGGVSITDAPGTNVMSSTIGGVTSALGNGGFGVSVAGSSNVILGSIVYGVPGLVVEGEPGARDRDHAATSTNATISNSTISGNNGDGVEVLDSSNLMLEGGVIQSNLGDGVLLMDAPFAVIFSDISIGGTTAGLGNGLAGVDIVGSINVTVNASLEAGNGGDAGSTSTPHPSTAGSSRRSRVTRAWGSRSMGRQARCSRARRSTGPPYSRTPGAGC